MRASNRTTIRFMASASRRRQPPATDATIARTPPVATPRELLLAHADLLRALFVFVAERNGLSGEESRAFETFARRRLAADDHALVREFRGRSSFATYLTVVVQRTFAAFQDAEEGKPGSRGRLMPQETMFSDE